jgi:chromosome segregation ATPase
MQASLLADLHSCERQLGKQREVEMTLRAELDDARKDVVRLSALSQELEALKADASGYRVDLASMKGSQHRMTQQLQFLSDQLAQANHDKLELTKELEEMSDVVIRMESQLRQSRGAHQEAGR